MNQNSNRKSNYEVYTRKLKAMGLKATPQRLAILCYLEQNRIHPSAEDIYRELKGEYPSLSLATIYGTMIALARAGELQELTIDPERKRFDINPKPHGHFLCHVCGRVYDLGAEAPVSSFEGLEGFLVEKCIVNFYGICPNCREKDKKQ